MDERKGVRGEENGRGERREGGKGEKDCVR